MFTIDLQAWNVWLIFGLIQFVAMFLMLRNGRRR